MTIYRNDSYFRASGTRDAFGGLSAALVADGFPEIPVNDGDRETGEQEEGFRKRYRPATSATDRGPYGDRRYWPGHGWWVRIVDGGTMAVPGASNHEKRRSGDLGYPYNSNTPAWRRAVQLAPRFNITCEGSTWAPHLRELWHWTFWGALGVISSGSTAGDSSQPFEPTPKGFLMSLNDQEQKDLLDSVIALKVAFLDGRPETGFALRPADQILTATTAALARINPADQGYDQFQLIVSLAKQIFNAVTNDDVDIEKLLSEMEDRLRGTFVQQFSEFGVALRAEVLADLADVTVKGGASVEEITAAFDAALGRLRLSVTPGV